MDDRRSIVQQGYLNKRAPHKLRLNTWKKRFFVLRDNGLLAYYKTHEITALGLIGQIPIRDATVIVFSTETLHKENLFGLKSKGEDRTYILECANVAERSKWINSLVGQGAVEGREDHVNPNARIEGYLQKQGGSVKAFKSRYFILLDDALYYYKQKHDAKEAGIIRLTPVSAVKPLTLDNHKHCFTVTPGSGQREYVFMASSDQERTDWMVAVLTIVTELYELAKSATTPKSKRTKVFQHSFREGNLLKSKDSNGATVFKRYFTLFDDRIVYYQSLVERRKCGQFSITPQTVLARVDETGQVIPVTSEAGQQPTSAPASPLATTAAGSAPASAPASPPAAAQTDSSSFGVAAAAIGLGTETPSSADPTTDSAASSGTSTTASPIPSATTEDNVFFDLETETSSEPSRSLTVTTSAPSSPVSSASDSSSDPAKSAGLPPYCFVVTPYPGASTYYLGAKNDWERNGWLESLQKVIVDVTAKLKEQPADTDEEKRKEAALAKEKELEREVEEEKEAPKVLEQQAARPTSPAATQSSSGAARSTSPGRSGHALSTAAASSTGRATSPMRTLSTSHERPKDDTKQHLNVHADKKDTGNPPSPAGSGSPTGNPGGNTILRMNSKMPAAPSTGAGSAPAIIMGDKETEVVAAQRAVELKEMEREKAEREKQTADKIAEAATAHALQQARAGTVDIGRDAMWAHVAQKIDSKALQAISQEATRKNKEQDKVIEGKIAESKKSFCTLPACYEPAVGTSGQQAKYCDKHYKRVMMQTRQTLGQ